MPALATLETVLGVPRPHHKVVITKGEAKEQRVDWARIQLVRVLTRANALPRTHQYRSDRVSSLATVGHADEDTWQIALKQTVEPQISFEARHPFTQLTSLVRRLEYICHGEGCACRAHTRAVVVSHRCQGPEARQACIQRGVHLDGKVSRDHHVQLACVHMLDPRTTTAKIETQSRLAFSHVHSRAVAGTSPRMTVGPTLETTS